MLPFREIIQELFYEKTRIILTILAIAWGTFAIATMLAIGEGLRLDFTKLMESAGHNLLTITAGSSSKEYRGISRNTPVNLTKSDLGEILALPNVVVATPQYSFASSLSYQTKKIGAQLLAVASDYFNIHQIKLVEGGRFINSIDVNDRKMVAVLGSEAADLFFPDHDQAIGKTVLIADRPFTIIGVMAQKSQLMATEMPYAHMNWIPASTYEMLVNPQVISNISLTYSNPKMLSQTRQQIQNIIAMNHGLAPDDESIINFTDLAKEQQQINSFFVGMQVFLGIVGGLTLLVAGVGIANVMFASVKRATQQIGVRMAIGATKRHILEHYIIESLVATALGGAIGIIMTVLFVYAIDMIPLHGKLIEAIGKPQPVLSFLVLGIVVLILGIVGFLAGLFPALKAAKVDPAEALVYE